MIHSLLFGDTQDKESKASFSMIQEENLDGWMESLSAQERKAYESLKFPPRQKQYLLGRYCAKLAVCNQLNLSSHSSISIETGVFRQPIIRGIPLNGLMISLSHTDSSAIALSFYDRYTCGVDMELISSHKSELIAPLLSEKEKTILKKLGRKEEESFLLAWSAKESLSKALRTGLSLPFELLEIRSVDQNGDHFEIRYVNFIQYSSINFIHNSHVISITKPKDISIYGLSLH